MAHKSGRPGYRSSPGHVPSGKRGRSAARGANRSTPSLPAQASPRARAAVGKTRPPTIGLPTLPVRQLVPRVDARNATRMPGVPDKRSTGRRRGR